MTLKDLNKKLFPAVYRTKDGKLVEITGFAFIGTFLDESQQNTMVKHAWDSEGNYMSLGSLYGRNRELADLMELLKGPSIDSRYERVPAISEKNR